MKLLTICACLAALAMPAAATAHHGKRHHHYSAKAAAAKNAAWACKQLRAKDKAAFVRDFGTNRNGRNAYGKCVSWHAHSKKHHHHHHHARTITLQNVTVRSTGTVTDGGAANCQFTDAGCTLTSSGTLDGILGGTYASTWTILWKQATSNGAGGYCAPATGTTTLAFPVVGSLTKTEKGTVCEVGATGSNVEHVLKDGTFDVSGGTGLLSKATGTGTVSFDQKPGSSGALGGVVTGVETFSTLTVTL